MIKTKAGQHISCPRCHNTATITKSDGRYHTSCPSCGDNSLLKEYHAVKDYKPLSPEEAFRQTIV